MKYIDKQNEASKEAAERLHDWRDEYIYQKKDFPQYHGMTFREICKALTGGQLWDLLNNKDPYRKSLRIEQNNLCCYCCEELKNGTGRTAIDHFEDKNTNPCKTFNYDNLLLACDGNRKKKIYRFLPYDSWETVAKHFETTPEALKLQITNLSFISGEEVSVEWIHHCDAAKGNKSILINPSLEEEKTCWERFNYDSDGNIKAAEGDSDAQNTIDVLNLNVTILQNKRKNAWAGFDKIIETEINDVIENFGVNTKEAVEFLLKTSPSFCVVKWALLKSVI